MKKFQKYYYDKIFKEANASNGIIDDTFDVIIKDLYITELPEFFKDLEIKGAFNVANNQLKTCKNFPKCDEINARYNNLISFEGLTYFPKGEFVASYNNIRSLEHLSEITDLQIMDFYINNNNIESMRGLEHANRVNMLAIHHNNITSGKYLPKKIEYCDISNNKISSFKYMDGTYYRLYIEENWTATEKDFEEFEGIIILNLSITSSLDEFDIKKIFRDHGIRVPYTINVYNENSVYI